LIVHPEKVVKKGIMFKKGNIFKRYKEEYIFYLEEPNFLKSGKKGKPLSNCVDIRLAKIKISPESTTKFKLTTPKVNLALKCESAKEREDWTKAIQAVIAKSNGGRVEDYMFELDSRAS